MLFQGDEETFKKKSKDLEEKVVDSKVSNIMKRLEIMTHQIDLISRYLDTVSSRVGKALDASVAYQRDLDDLERRINLVKSRMDDLENVVPEVEIKDRIGRKAA
jgi:hypothetical protein